MSNRVNLADPDFEPTDEQLIDLSKRAFANVARDHEVSLRRLYLEIEQQREITFNRFADRIAQIKKARESK